MELGFYTFGDLVADPKTGRTYSAKERMRQLLDLARLTEDAGLDVLGVGEHHGLNFVNSSTATTLAAMAAITKRIRLTSATTLLSTADPVRTFQDFATVDLVSDGRAELIFGRGAYADNFPLFGFDTKDYDALFVEKLALFAQLNTQERVTWSGKFRAALRDAEIAPRPVQPQLPVWIGAGSPGSLARAAALGYPAAIPVLGGSLPGYAQLAAFYRQHWAQQQPGQPFKLAVFSHFHLSATAQQTREDFYPYYSAYLQPLFKGPMPRQAYADMLAPTGSLIAGSPQQVLDKLMQLKQMGVTRYVGQVDIGGQLFADVARQIELFSSQVAPHLRQA